MHAKIQTVMRYYDRMLEDRLSHAYTRHSVSNYKRRPSYQQSIPQTHAALMSPRANGVDTSYYNVPSSPPHTQSHVSYAPSQATYVSSQAGIRSPLPAGFGSYYNAMPAESGPTQPPYSPHDIGSNVLSQHDRVAPKKEEPSLIDL